MGLFKRVKKAIKRTVRKVENFAHRATGRPEIGEKEPAEEDLGTRAAAAKRLVKTDKQAGSGQISFNTMEEDQT